MKEQLTALPRWAKRLLMLLTDAAMLPLALWAAYALRLGSVSPDLGQGVWLLPAAPLFAIPVLIRFGLYRAIIRYIAPQAAYSVIAGVTISTATLLGVAVFLRLEGIPRSVFIIYWIIAILYIGGSRFFMRNYLARPTRALLNGREPVAIYGAGSGGTLLAANLNAGSQFVPVAFVDDDRALHGHLVSGLRVFDPAALATIARQMGVQQVFLAIPSATRSQRKTIIEALEAQAFRVQTLPTMDEIARGVATLNDIREVSVEDLLGRDPVPPRAELLEACIRDRVVMVTGAGGSIGSELCRQIIALQPRKLLLYELSEYALYAIEQELRSELSRIGVNIEIVALLGSVLQRSRIENVIRSFGVDTLYHAAAYKHVPMVEHNVIEGIQNNAFGTWQAAEAAYAAGVEHFVLISTDKAVRPTNVMGASKRLAELVLQALAERGGPTKFCMVRFGNVLGSSGSVVPLFEKQIHAGGPVTVTDPAICRYFMTLSEAAQLVIQAGAMGHGGEVYLLDMGEPVRIADLARRMIHLSGMEVRDESHPEGDIAIEYTGLRPGEKLYEELLIGSDAVATAHPRIWRGRESALAWVDLEPLLETMNSACVKGDCSQAVALLREAVPEYSPDGLHDHLCAVGRQPPNKNNATSDARVFIVK
ncbi:MAG: polysaccharide biosynthesis protein [Proteobacteria bacterium]|nr:MAG: polysaccharide biosynthesis protein [Pseudomonadota bacterium]